MLYLASLLLLVVVHMEIYEVNGANPYVIQTIQPGKKYVIRNDEFPSLSNPADINGWHFRSDKTIVIDCMHFHVPAPVNCDPIMFLIDDGVNGQRRRGDITFKACTDSQNLKIVYFHPPGSTPGGKFYCEVQSTEKSCNSDACVPKKQCTAQEYWMDWLSGLKRCKEPSSPATKTC